MIEPNILWKHMEDYEIEFDVKLEVAKINDRRNGKVCQFSGDSIENCEKQFLEFRKTDDENS